MQVVRRASVLKGSRQEKARGAELQRRNDNRTGGGMALPPDVVYSFVDAFNRLPRLSASDLRTCYAEVVSKG